MSIAPRRQYDPMGSLVLSLGDDLEKAWTQAVSDGAWNMRKGPRPRAILVGGMGGSAMAGLLVEAVLRDRLSLPIQLCRQPQLPAWICPGDLVLLVSYSGNTGETLALADGAAERGARICVISAGGSLGDQAASRSWPWMKIPEGLPPRAALGWMAGGALALLRSLEGESLETELAADVGEAVALLRAQARAWAGWEEETGKIAAGGARAAQHSAEPASGPPPSPAPWALAPWDLAARYVAGFPVLYGIGPLGSMVALRWKTQLQENGKHIAKAEEIPESAHNEIVGWGSLASCRPHPVVTLVGADAELDGKVARPRRAPEGEPRTTLLHALVEGLYAELERAGMSPILVPWSGRSALARAMGLIQRGDLASVAVARLKGVEATPVEPIQRLKDYVAHALES